MDLSFLQLFLLINGTFLCNLAPILTALRIIPAVYPGYDIFKTRNLHLLKNELATNTKTYPSPGEKITENGYPFESHAVTTTDGYILEIHRIPHGKNQSFEHGRNVVLIMHGTLGSSLDWVADSPNKSLGFLLADYGYDVWMMNARGNRYSKSHDALSPSNRAFWNFSFHEIALYDIPNTMDYILERTHVQKICYVGFSMGCTVLHILLSEFPEYNDKLKASAEMAPAVYLTNAEELFAVLTPIQPFLKRALDLVGIYEFPSLDHFFLHMDFLCFFINLVADNYCSDFISTEISDNDNFILFAATDRNAGGSMKIIYHFMQIKNADRFQFYDNDVFDSYQPPAYNLSQTIIPVAIFTGQADTLVTETDVDRLVRELPNVVLRFQPEDSNFGHPSFIFSEDAADLVYHEIIDFITQYN